jgi:hypothetical protein
MVTSHLGLTSKDWESKPLLFAVPCKHISEFMETEQKSCLKEMSIGLDQTAIRDQKVMRR